MSRKSDDDWQESHQPTSLVFDNIDRLEETLSGAGTTHRVNGISIQRGSIGPIPEFKKVQAPKTKKRSINVFINEFFSYNPGQRPEAPSMCNALEFNALGNVDTSGKQKNFLWILLRMKCAVNQTIPSWTGFNIILRSDEMVVQDRVRYLSTINGPATSMATINEMLGRALRIKEQLELTFIVIVCDQAIYCKALEIKRKCQDKYSSVILRLGDFHAVCTFMATIGKRFGDAGLQDIAIESGVISEGSVKRVLDGRAYNRAVRKERLLVIN